jgi:UPF0755 protein
MNLPPQDIENTGLNDFSERRFLFKKIFSYFIVPILFVILVYYFFFNAPFNFPKGIVVTIEPGEILRNVSLDLKEKNIIRSRVAFEAFIIMNGGEKHIATGDYLFENKLPVFEVARRIAQKDRRLASVKITIPEGFNDSQIADSVSLKLRNFKKEVFLSKAQEGYLFPDTYFFFSSDNEEDVLKYMSENFEKKIKSVESEIKSFGKSENEIITMASLVEREAKGNIDRGYIAGILWNRISKGMPLQVDSAPGTYKTKGLPTEPICNPGMESIKASIHPVASKYLYYLHDKNGVIHYARTFEEHKKNKLKYL